VNKNVRNILIVLGLALLVGLIGGGTTGVNLAIQAVSLVFLASIAWVASLMYRQHRIELYALGDVKRATLYVAAAVAALTLTATSRLWATAAGEIAWLVLMGGAVYAVFAVFWSARKY
jgi:chromate transport protein ChrA